MLHRLIWLPVALVLWILAAPSAASQPSSDVPLDKVILFSSGVGYFEHNGTVRGDASMTLRFETEQVQDVLKSLVLQDLDGGRIGTVAYPTRQPLARTLSDPPLRLSAPQGMGALFNQMRGERVAIRTATDSIEGTILSAEQRSDSPDARSVTWHLNLYADGHIRSVPIHTMRGLHLQNEALQTSMADALDALATARSENERPIQLRFEGTGTRRIRFGYVVEAPVWKTSYRVLLPDADGEGQLQGWAIVDNQTESDWSAVDVTLVSGSPLSFVQDLYTPLYVDRPVVDASRDAAGQPRAYEGGTDVQRGTSASRIEVGGSTSGIGRRSIGGRVRDAATGEPLPGASLILEETGTSAAADQSGRYLLSGVSPGTYTLRASFVGYTTARRTVQNTSGPLRADVFLAPSETALSEVVVTAGQASAQRSVAEPDAAPLDPTQGVASAATTEAVGAFFQYQIGTVSLDHGQSAMLPIVTQEVDVERVSLYDPSVQPTHPLQAVRMENTTGLHLAAGPVTVFDDGSYAGDARLTDTPPNQTRFFTYALNQDLRVDPGGGRTARDLTTGFIDGGVLTLQRTRIATQTYTVTNNSKDAADVILQHPRRSNWTLTEPSRVEESTPDVHRLRITVDGDDTETLTVREEQPVSETVRLSDATPSVFELYASNDVLPRDVRRALRQASELRRDVDQAQRALSRAERRRDRAVSEQERVRKNMEAVSADTDYHQRLMSKMTDLEDRIETLREDIDAQSEALNAAENALREYLRTLDAD